MKLLTTHEYIKYIRLLFIIESKIKIIYAGCEYTKILTVLPPL